MRPKLQGFLDGLRDPFDLRVGMTFDDQDANENYDRGVNMGQAVGMAYIRLRDAIFVLRHGGRVQPSWW